MDYFFIGIIILFLSGITSILFKNKIAVLSLISAVASVLCIIPAVDVLLNGNSLVQSFDFNSLFGTVNFVIDPLAAFFVIVISVMSLASVIYSKGYLKPYIEKGKNINSHLVFLPVLIASMMTVVTCQNALMFLICWEIMSLSSFFLVIFENEKKEVRRAGIKYLVFMHLSVLFIMAAFAMLSLKSGSFDFASFKMVLQNNSHFANVIFMLTFIGFGTKAGFVPFHNWLPDAHPAAPSHVSAIMSGVMIKTGIYGILRTLDLIGTPSKSIAYAVLIISIVSALYGVLYAITQHDLKRLLAYHSIENIGIIGMGLGVGMLGLAYNSPVVAVLGFAGGILHILNHSIFKELLFLSAGSVYTKTHTRDIETLGGLIKVMPKTAILFLIGSVAICGLPPFNGFISEFLVYFGMFKGLAVHNFFSVIM
ncbi:hydrogenase, partial [bacterium]|nr:hydrogenase [bacterium]